MDRDLAAGEVEIVMAIVDAVLHAENVGIEAEAGIEVGRGDDKMVNLPDLHVPMVLSRR